MADLYSTLPPEVFDVILRTLIDELPPKRRKAELLSLALVSKKTNDLVMPALYEKLVITRKDAALLFLGVRPTPRDSPYKVRYNPVQSDRETDDEKAPSRETIRANTGRVPWERRRQLLAYCKHLTVLQVPSFALVEDLVNACRVAIPETKAWPDRDAYEACGPKDKAARRLVTYGDDQDCDSLFPNIVDLCLSWRVVKYTGRWKNKLHPNGAWIRADAAHPFLHLVRHTFGAPTNVCVVGPQYGHREPSTFGSNEAHVLDGVSPSKIARVSIHGVPPVETRWAGNPGDPDHTTASQATNVDKAKVEGDLPYVDHKTSVRHQYFYERYGQEELYLNRVGRIVGLVNATAPGPGQTTWATFEHVDATASSSWTGRTGNTVEDDVADRLKRDGYPEGAASRISFIKEPESDWCTVCMYRHAEFWRENLGREVTKAWNPPAYGENRAYCGDRYDGYSSDEDKNDNGSDEHDDDDGSDEHDYDEIEEEEGEVDHSQCWKLGYGCGCGEGEDVDHSMCWKAGYDDCGCGQD